MGYRVLVVDDSPMYRILLKEMFQILGHEVIGEADSGASAIQAHQELKPELITLDISLPDSDGLAVLREIRQSDPKVRVIIVSGNDQDKVLAQAKALGAADFLIKPFRKENLADILNRMGSGATPAT